MLFSDISGFVLLRLEFAAQQSSSLDSIYVLQVVARLECQARIQLATAGHEGHALVLHHCVLLLLHIISPPA